MWSRKDERIGQLTPLISEACMCTDVGLAIGSLPAVPFSYDDSWQVGYRHLLPSSIIWYSPKGRGDALRLVRLQRRIPPVLRQTPVG